MHWLVVFSHSLQGEEQIWQSAFVLSSKYPLGQIHSSERDNLFEPAHELQPLAELSQVLHLFEHFIQVVPLKKSPSRQLVHLSKLSTHDLHSGLQV